MYTIQDKVSYVISYFSKQKIIKTELIYHNPYELLIAIILSAQCLDARVNIVTKTLFQKYKSFHELSNANVDDVYYIIKTISYPQVKAHNIIQVSSIIHNNYNDIIPNSLQKLIEIKGIGRKTGILTLSILYNYKGIAVDTHVARVSQRLGLVPKTNNIYKIELTLSHIFPIDIHNKLNPWFVIFGRYTCKSKKPMCEKCQLKHICCYDKNIP